MKYELGVDLLFDTPYAEILDIFARINSYTVKLQPQEIFNARYLGYFKQTIYRLGFRYVTYYIDGGILTKANVTRMSEAELSADLMVALIDKIQSNKTVENYYKIYEDEQGDVEKMESRFEEIMSYIGAIYSPLELKNTNFSRVQLFYSLFTAIGHLLFSVNGLDPQLRKPINTKSIGKIRVALDNVSALYDEVAENLDSPQYPKDYKDFISATRRGTTDTSARVFRGNFLVQKIAENL